MSLLKESDNQEVAASTLKTDTMQNLKIHLKESFFLTIDMADFKETVALMHDCACTIWNVDASRD